MSEHRDLAVDAPAAVRLAERGLTLRILDTEDRAAFDAWLQADARGFHTPAMTDAELGWWSGGLAARRVTGVYDGDTVVATASSWPAPMTVPGGDSVLTWAISSVSVAPTHRRRGVARAMLEAELRAAAALGLPLAVLTVSESTLYGRYGFGAATFASDYTIDTRRAAWTGPTAAGRLEFITTAQWRDAIDPLFERARRQWPGAIEVFPLRWDQLGALKTEDATRARRMRAVAHHDEGGALRGLLLYLVEGGDDDFAQHHATVVFLCAETDDAYAALWRFVLELDLTTEVRAGLRATDESVRWMIADQRAIKQTVTDHHWVRIMDVPAALQARRYERDGVLRFRVDDELGFATGGWRLEVADGRATVTADDAPEFAVTVQELSAAYLGAVPPTTPQLDLFRTARAPWLGTWY